MTTDSFASRLTLALKLLNISRGRLACELQVDKSVIGRWLAGSVKPAEHNLVRLTAALAVHRPGFSVLDWDRGEAEFMAALGAAPQAPAPPAAAGLPLPLMDQFISATQFGGGAYEGFFRTTRMCGQAPGRFMHDHGLVTRAANGLLRFQLGAGGADFDGWLLPHRSQLMCVATDMASGAMVFGIFHGVPQHRAELIDGMILATANDLGHTINSAIVVVERVDDLSGDADADQAHYRQLIAGNPLAPEGSVPATVRSHLVRDFGPSAKDLADLAPNLPLFRSLARGAWLAAAE